MVAVFWELGRDAFGGDKDEPSVDATCDVVRRPNAPLRRRGSRFTAGEGREGGSRERITERRCGRTVRSEWEKYVLMSSEESESEIASERAAALRPRTQSKAKPPSRQALRLLASSPDRNPGNGGLAFL